MLALRYVNRVLALTHTKQVLTNYDGFGRITASCEINALAGNSACLNANSSANGFSTGYTYNPDGTLASVSRMSSTQTQTKSFTYDAAGRVLTATYPESGTLQYFYDVSPSTPGVSCGTQANLLGRLGKTYDADGNTLCFYYDSEGRMTGKLSNGSPNFDGSSFFYVYDAATVNGVVMSNTTGRLAEAYTANTWNGAKITDEGFSYDALGRLTDVYQSTPHSGGYY